MGQNLCFLLHTFPLDSRSQVFRALVAGVSSGLISIGLLEGRVRAGFQSVSKLEKWTLGRLEKQVVGGLCYEAVCYTLTDTGGISLHLVRHI